MDALHAVNLPQEKEKALREFVDGFVHAHPDEIEEIKLFGSYARGEQKEDSDIDVFIATNLPEERVRMRTPLWMEAITLAEDIDYKYDYTIGISPRLISREYMNAWSPFMENVRREGITIWTKEAKTISA